VHASSTRQSEQDDSVHASSTRQSEHLSCS